MSRLGADPDALRDLGARLRSAARQVDETAEGLERRMRSTAWHGVDADRFGSEWQRVHRPRLVQLSALLRRTSSRLDGQAEDQLHASSGRGDGAATASGATPSSVPAPGGAPREELQVRAGSQVTAGGLVFGLRQDLALRRLPGGRTSITTSETQRGGVVVVVGAGAGLRAGAGAGLRAGVQDGASGRGRVLAAQGEARLTVAQVIRRQYEVRDGQVGGTIARLAAQEAVGRLGESVRQAPVLGLAASTIGPAVGVWDRVLDDVTGGRIDLDAALDGLDIAPAPDRVETLAEVAVGGSLGVALASTLGVEATTELSGALRIGDSVVDGRRDAVLVEADGSVAATLQGRLFDQLGLEVPGRRAVQATLRIEAPVHPVDGVDLIVTTTTTDGSTLHLTTSNVAAAGHATDAALGLGRAVEHLRDGDVIAAAEELARLDLSADAASSTSSSMTVTDHALLGDATVGQGVGVGLEGEGGVRRLERVG